MKHRHEHLKKNKLKSISNIKHLLGGGKKSNPLPTIYL